MSNTNKLGIDRHAHYLADKLVRILSIQKSHESKVLHTLGIFEQLIEPRQQPSDDLVEKLLSVGLDSLNEAQIGIRTPDETRRKAKTEIRKLLQGTK